MLTQAIAQAFSTYGAFPLAQRRVSSPSIVEPNPIQVKESPKDRVEISKEAQSLLASKVQLTEAERKEVEELKKRDAEVRRHEQAHAAAAGGYAKGGPVYEYAVGPDNKRYAVGGHVKIDSSEIPGDPEATLRKAQILKQAANAPAEPSPEDRQVASKAAQLEAESRKKIQEEKSKETLEFSQDENEGQMEPDGYAAYVSRSYQAPNSELNRAEASINLFA